MQILSSVQLSQLDFSRGIKTSNKFLATGRELEVGEALLITKDEWPYKNTPTASPFSYRQRGKKFSVRKLSSGLGWAVIRTK